ncbi:MAG: hypothetical protein KKD44_16935 [Proteobacteria bacterium]|nr:hypothetical protein [Pseudomonadota bacterium]
MEPEKVEHSLETICKSLAEYAVERDDINDLVQSLPTDMNINTVTLSYELQLLKIISVGWSFSVFMADHPKKNQAAEVFWSLIRDFSKDISNVTGMMIGHTIDYFQLIKDRFDYYVSCLDQAVKNDDPASAIGPAFAESCKDTDNPFITITGARIFNYSSHAVKEYLGSVGLSIH